MYKSAIWQFSKPSLKSTYEAMLSPLNSDSLVMRSQDRSEDGVAEPSAKLIGERFSIAFSEELQLRDLTAERVAMRAVIDTEKLSTGHPRTRVELDVIAKVPRATQNELIEALGAAKRRCAASVGRNIKILLKAELKLGSVEFDRRPNRPTYGPLRRATGKGEVYSISAIS